MLVVNMSTPEGAGRTILKSFCVECRDSPRAPRAAVVLSGPSGFPPQLFGSCPNCGVEFVAVQVGAGPLRRRTARVRKRRRRKTTRRKTKRKKKRRYVWIFLSGAHS